MLRAIKATILVLSFSILPALAQNITASEAAKHVGEHATVCGRVVSEHTASSSVGQPTFINLDRSYPNQVFTAVVWERDKAKVGAIPSSGLVCVSGTIFRSTEVYRRLFYMMLRTGHQEPRRLLNKLS